jgi:pimeloyl-ACP methyl ester carboxylesterase
MADAVMADKQRMTLSTGVDLDVWTAGDPANPAIIFLHGFPESHRTWRHQMAALCGRYFCVAPDQRGYARSSKPQKVTDYAVPKLVADVFALADALGIERFTLAAHDWGGAIGWAAALGRPERVERLIIANAPHPYVFQKMLIEDLAQRAASQYIRAFRDNDLEQRISENGVAWFFDHSFMRHLTQDDVGQEERALYLDQWSQPGALTAMFNWYRASPMTVPAMDEVVPRPPFLDAPFPTLAMPVLIVWGLDDKALLPCMLEGLDVLINDLTIERIDGAGHFVPWEAPERVTDAMMDWLP